MDGLDIKSVKGLHKNWTLTLINTILFYLSSLKKSLGLVNAAY